MPLNNPIQNSDLTQWAGKSIATFGDSITWYDGNAFLETHSEYGLTAKGYQSFMREKLGCTVNNYGTSGYDMPDVCTRIKATTLTGFDAIIITAGANDFKDMPTKIGEIAAVGATFATDTYYGALQEAIEYIHGINPAIKIFLLTPIKGWIGALDSVIPETYPNAMISVARLYSIPVCDLYHGSGINELTKSAYIGDLEATGYHLHPTNAGFSRMADIIVPFLKNEYDSAGGQSSSGGGSALVASYVVEGTNIDCSAIVLDIVTGIFTSTAHGFVDTDEVSIQSHYTQLVPTCAVNSTTSSGTRLYVIEATENTFKLSATSGGASLTWTYEGVTTAGYWSIGKSSIATVTFTGLSAGAYILRGYGHMHGGGASSPVIDVNNAYAYGKHTVDIPTANRVDWFDFDLRITVNAAGNFWHLLGVQSSMCVSTAKAYVWAKAVANSSSVRSATYYDEFITRIDIKTNSSGNAKFLSGTRFEVWSV